jgi:ribosome-associated toxin RatA of RatAB toxin-antitoxin module
MSVTDSATVVIEAPVEQVLTLLRDIDNQATWFPGNTVSEVLERDPDGLPVKARLVNDVKVAKDEFELDYTHTGAGFSWRLVAPTRVQKAQTGSWSLHRKGADRTEATLTLTVDSALPLPGFIQRRTVGSVVKGATSALVRQF